MRYKYILIIFFLVLFLPTLFSIQVIPNENNTLAIPSTDTYYPAQDNCFGDVCIVLGEGETLPIAKENVLKDFYTFETSTIENLLYTANPIETYHIPVLLVAFPNLQPPEELTLSVYDEVFNSPDYLSGDGISVKEFYKYNSYGKLNVTFDIYDWRTLPHPYEYYVANTNSINLAVDSVNLFGTGSNAIDFTQYDSDNDGRIDGFIIVHSGYSNQDHGSVPGFPQNISTKALILKYANAYSIQGKLYGNTAILQGRHKPYSCNSWQNSTFGYPSDCRLSIDDAVHEFAHVLGLPDLYEINCATGTQTSYGLAAHTVMVASSDSPQDRKKPINFDAWSKFFFGWLNPTVINSIDQAGKYTLTSFDTTDSAYILHNPDTMLPREYFLIVNRYIGDDSLDRYLFGVTTLPYNVLGGLDIFHIDEEHISHRYSGDIGVNCIMHDPDGLYYNNTGGHPGILFEQNVLTGNYTTYMRVSNDLYTSEIYPPTACSPEIFEGKFDNIARIDPNCSTFIDTTSESYNGLIDSGIRVYPLTHGGKVMKSYFSITEPLELSAQIVSPQNNSVFYTLNNVLDFQAEYENNIGDAQCEWSYEASPDSGNLLPLSNSCSFSLNLINSPFNQEGVYSVTLKVTDEFEREATSSINFSVYLTSQLQANIFSPLDNSFYYQGDSLSFSPVISNNVGDISCEWKKFAILEGFSTISTSCSGFIKTTQQLGLNKDKHPGTYVIILTVQDQIKEVNSTAMIHYYGILPTRSLNPLITPNKNINIVNGVYKPQKNQ